MSDTPKKPGKKAARQAAEPRRLNRATSIAEPLRRVTRPLIKSHGFSDPQIVHRWRSLVGDRMADLSCPMKLSRQRSGAGTGGATLTVRVVGAAALEMEHAAPQIIERINTFYGYRAVGRIVLEQGPLPKRRRKDELKVRELSDEEIKTIEEGASRVRNPELRQALANLGKAIKSRETGAD